MRPATGRRLAVALGVAAVLAGTAGCGFLQDLADPNERPGTTGQAPAAPDAAPTTEPAAGPVVVAQGALQGRRGGGTLTVTVGQVVSGLVPPVPNFSDSCPVAGSALQYVPVEFAFSEPGFAARLEVERGPATPDGIGDVGIVVESGNGDERYCFDYPPLPTADRFWNQMGAATVTGYVVLDAAITAATPEGRPEVFPTLRLRITDLRAFTDPTRITRLAPGELSVGAPCPDDPDAICAPLG